MNEIRVVYYARCNHVVSNRVLDKDTPYEMSPTYDWCPKCTAEILAKMDDQQQHFDMAFGVVDEGANT